MSPLGRRKSVAGQLAGEVDLVLVVATVAVAVVGVVMVYSATRTTLSSLGGDPQYYLKRQAIWMALGVAAMAAVSSIDYRRLENVAVLAYGGVVAALVFVMSPLGSSAKGSQRWIALGSFQLQPSAFAGLIVVIFLGRLLAGRHSHMTARRLVAALAVAALPMALVTMQPDLGSALIIAAVCLAVLTVAGIPARYLAALAVAATLGAVAMFNSGTLKAYQQARLTAFIDQSASASQYNLTQSKIAIAHGGLTGQGLFRGSQTNLSYVPEQRTDFIFTAVGEQLGFAGSATVLTLFGVIIWRIWRAASDSRDRFGTLVCVGVMAMIVIQVFVNAGMTMGIMPITGIPLPFLSYGGSSTIAMFAAVGVANSVRMRRFAAP